MGKRGFTLIELLMVIGIVAVLAAVVFVAVNPARRFRETRNSTRRADVKAILDAVLTHQVDNRGTLVAGVDATLRMLGTAASGCSVTCGSGGAVETVAVRVADGNDDAEEQNPPNGSMYLTSTDLELIRDGAISQEVGMRFRNLAIPPGATITNASIRFTVDEIDSEATNLTFWGEAQDNAPAFSGVAGNITSRTKTSASVSWNAVPAWTVVGATADTPNLASLIQQIVSRPGWVAGNAVVIIVNGTGKRTAVAYNGTPATAPLLTVEYASGGGVTADACLDVGAALQDYLGAMPRDPSIGTNERTYYAIQRIASRGIKVVACNPEDNEVIEVSR